MTRLRGNVPATAKKCCTPDYVPALHKAHAYKGARDITSWPSPESYATDPADEFGSAHTRQRLRRLHPQSAQPSHTCAPGAKRNTSAAWTNRRRALPYAPSTA